MLIPATWVSEEAQVACLLREVGDGKTKASLRSRGVVDVGSAAQALGGGGHHNAAGFTIDATVEEAIQLVREALR